jgi:hypothetical protein
LETGQWTGGVALGEYLAVVFDAPDKSAAATLIAGVRGKMDNNKATNIEN